MMNVNCKHIKNGNLCKLKNAKFCIELVQNKDDVCSDKLEYERPKPPPAPPRVVIR